jgi:rhodanese-related sulfurtransferase
MKKIINSAGMASVAAVWLLAGVCQGHGATVADLQKRLAEGKPVTIIDVRPNELYRNGHIEGAINIPANLLPAKKLPALGQVIVCAEGLGRDKVEESVSCLNGKTGIQAEALDGGFAAWETAQGGNTRPMGLQSESLIHITYDQLKTTKMTDVVLVDLRRNSLSTRQSVNSATNVSEAALTDLSKEFPGAVISPSPFSLAGAKQSSANRRESAPLLVLIDTGNGIAEETARSLQANGYRRVVILAGGEQTLARQGQPGLQRMGLGSVMTSGADH